jgi:beta-lactamase superfamily II metal-dependent hydrolase
MNCLTQSEKETEKLSIPPKADELEVTVFGPGVGESIVVHLGVGEWIIVDSCRSPVGERKPLPLAYLDLLGVEVGKQVSRIVATHWHDDHVAGLGEVVECCQQAELWLTPAIAHDEIITLVQHHLKHPPPEFGSGVGEMGKLLEVLRTQGRTYKHASETCSVIASTARAGKVEVTCLAPSAMADVAAKLRTRSELKDALKLGGRLPSFHENDGSIVLHIRVGAHHLLLGGDLEEKGIAGMGWMQAVATHKSQGLGKVAHVFKIPHHGSINGYHLPVWMDVVHDEPWALITPYRKSNLPALAGLKAIMKHTDRVYLTAAAKVKKIAHPDRSVNKTVSETTSGGIREAHPRNGAVRLRCNLEAPPHPKHWQVEVFGTACRVPFLP